MDILVEEKKYLIWSYVKFCEFYYTCILSFSVVRAFKFYGRKFCVLIYRSISIYV